MRVGRFKTLAYLVLGSLSKGACAARPTPRCSTCRRYSCVTPWIGGLWALESARESGDRTRIPGTYAGWASRSPKAQFSPQGRSPLSDGCRA